MSDLIGTALDELVDALPAWTAAADPTSELGIVLAAFAASIDALAAQAEQVYANTRLATADETALIEEWAWLYGVEHEQLPPTVEGLRGYLQELAAGDGSPAALSRALIALIDSPANRALPHNVIPDLVFAVGGGGLTFDAGGAGLTFGSGTGGWFRITENFTGFTFEVASYADLTFDRAAVARAIDRFRSVELLPATYVET